MKKKDRDSLKIVYRIIALVVALIMILSIIVQSFYL